MEGRSTVVDDITEYLIPTNNNLETSLTLKFDKISDLDNWLFNTI